MFSWSAFVDGMLALHCNTWVTKHIHWWVARNGLRANSYCEAEVCCMAHGDGEGASVVGPLGLRGQGASQDPCD